MMAETKAQNPRRRSSGLRWAMLVGGAAVVVVVLVAVFASRVAWSHWLIDDGLARAAGSPQFRLFVLLGFGSAALLGMAVGLWVRFGHRRRLGSQCGTVLIEFAMALPFLLMIVLLMVQSALLMGNYLCINYASYCAVRSAIVTIPSELGWEEANVVTDYADPAGSEKLRRIWQAAVWAVTPISDGSYNGQADYGAALNDGIDDLFGSYGASRPGYMRVYLERKLAYAEDNTQVTLDSPDSGDTYGPHEDIEVYVRHNLYLSVPYANRLVAIFDKDNAVDFGDGRYAVAVTVSCTLTNEGAQDIIEIEERP